MRGSQSQGTKSIFFKNGDIRDEVTLKYVLFTAVVNQVY